MGTLGSASGLVSIWPFAFFCKVWVLFQEVGKSSIRRNHMVSIRAALGRQSCLFQHCHCKGLVHIHQSKTCLCFCKLFTLLGPLCPLLLVTADCLGLLSPESEVCKLCHQRLHSRLEARMHSSEPKPGNDLQATSSAPADLHGG